MEQERYDISNTEVQMVMVIKLQQLKREALPALAYQNLEQYLSEKLWKDRLPRTLNEAADDILKIKPEDIVRFLSRKAMEEGSRKSLSDFRDVIEGD